MPIYHFHHIIPRHAGGTDDPSNLVKLTVEEHAAAHKKLWEEHNNIYDYWAWQGLSGMADNQTIISEIQKESGRRTGLMNTGRKHTEKSLDSMRRRSAKLKGLTRLPFIGKKISESKKGRPFSAEHKEKLRLAKLGKKLINGHYS